MSNAQCPVKTLENFSHKSQSGLMRCNESRLREDLKAQAKAFPHVWNIQSRYIVFKDKTRPKYNSVTR